MNHRTWIDSSHRTWELSLHDPSNAPMATPPNWPPGRPPANLPNPRIRFTDPANPTNHRSVPYTSDKPLSQLSDEEVAGYWEQVVAAHPEFAPPPTPD